MKSRRNNDGFTIADVLLTCAIIGMLAAISIPNFLEARVTAQNARFKTNMRVASDIFAMYTLAENKYPPDSTPGRIPLGMSDYLSRFPWEEGTAIGGKWDWDYRQFHFGCTAGVSVYRPSRTDDQMLEIDRSIDDGNIYTGMFRKRSDGYIFVIEF
jgi:general secretion pathway protein G